MQNHRKLILSVVVLIVAVALVGGISATLVMAGSGPKERPFNAIQQGTFVVFDDGSTTADDDCVFLSGPPAPGDTTCSFALEGSGTGICQDSVLKPIFVPNSAIHIGAFVLSWSVSDAISPA